MMTGSTPRTTEVWNRAIGVRPSDGAFSLVVISSAAAPSEICELFAAVIVPPSGRNAGFSAARPSRVPPRRMPSSASTLVAGRVRHRGDLAGEPALVLRRGGLGVRAEPEVVQLRPGEPPPVDDHLRAQALVRRDLVAVPEALPERPRPAADIPIGTRVIDSTPPAMATS